VAFVERVLPKLFERSVIDLERSDQWRDGWSFSPTGTKIMA